MTRLLSKVVIFCLSFVMVSSVMVVQSFDATYLNNSTKFAITVPQGYREEHIMNLAKTYVVRTNWYDSSGRLSHIIEYYPNTVLNSSRYSHVKMKHQTHLNGTLDFSEEYYDNTGVLFRAYWYHSGISYGSHAKGVKVKFNIGSGNVLLNSEILQNGTGYRTHAYEYFSGTVYDWTYGLNPQKNAIHKFYMHLNGTLDCADTFTQAGVHIRRDWYSADTQYQQNHGSRIVRTEHYNTYIYPIANAPITATPGSYPGHDGVDFGATSWTNIRATASGTVYKEGYSSTNGWYIILNHGNGVTSYYGHLVQESRLIVGDRVSQGQVIANVGQTGSATGPHVHFEIREGNKLSTCKLLSITYCIQAEYYETPNWYY